MTHRRAGRRPPAAGHRQGDRLPAARGRVRHDQPDRAAARLRAPPADGALRAAAARARRLEKLPIAGGAINVYVRAICGRSRRRRPRRRGRARCPSAARRPAAGGGPALAADGGGGSRRRRSAASPADGALADFRGVAPPSQSFAGGRQAAMSVALGADRAAQMDMVRADGRPRFVLFFVAPGARRAVPRDAAAVPKSARARVQAQSRRGRRGVTCCSCSRSWCSASRSRAP